MAPPKLFMSARADPYGGANSARSMYRWSTPPKKLRLVGGSLHGTDLLGPLAKSEVRQEVVNQILAFLKSNS